MMSKKYNASKRAREFVDNTIFESVNPERIACLLRSAYRHGQNDAQHSTFFKDRELKRIKGDLERILRGVEGINLLAREMQKE